MKILRAAPAALGNVVRQDRRVRAAAARGWSVHWYDRERVFRDAAAALGRQDVDALYAMGRSMGPPWQAGHKLAAAAALAAAVLRLPE